MSNSLCASPSSVPKDLANCYGSPLHGRFITIMGESIITQENLPIKVTSARKKYSFFAKFELKVDGVYYLNR